MSGRLLAFALAVLAALAGLDAWRLQEAQRLNAAIAAHDEPALRDSPAPHARFALASLAAARGNPQEALAVYQSLEETAPYDLSLAARYNRAQLYHQLAATAHAEEDPRALALGELAKQRYRDLLATVPGHWDARYNLDRVLRLVPDPLEEESEAASPTPPAERAVTTMRGYTLGLP
jgi:mxaK protein